MAKTLSRETDTRLYEEDFYLWAKRQAELLRNGRLAELDLAHLTEEVEDLGSNLRKAVTSRTREIILHLLKLQHSPAAEPRRSWHESVGKQRDDLELDLTPSLRREVSAELETIYQKARRRAADELARDQIAPAELPATCPYTLDEILAPGWLPENVYGVQD